MVQIPDDPIIRSAERTGYPPWIQDDGYDNDWEDFDEGVYYGNETDEF